MMKPFNEMSFTFSHQTVLFPNMDMKEQEKLKNILNLIDRYGMIDGSHHKQWLLDQIVKVILTPEEYEKWITEFDEEEQEEFIWWEKGIAP